MLIEFWVSDFFVDFFGQPSRKYGPDGKPEIDIDKPHQGYDRPHVHEWPGGRREHPGRDVCPI